MPAHRDSLSAADCRAGSEAFTLVELLIALAITGILLTWAAAGLAQWLPRYWQQSQAQALAEALQLARAEAIRRGHRVAVCPSVDGSSCDDGQQWERGYITFADRDDDVQAGAGESIVRFAPAAGHSVTVRGNRPVADYVSFTALGNARLRNGALQMGTFTVCLPGQRAIEVVLANGGRPRVQDSRMACA
jgi:type IV fimbrial biogenesis protein FimT